MYNKCTIFYQYDGILITSSHITTLEIRISFFITNNRLIVYPNWLALYNCILNRFASIYITIITRRISKRCFEDVLKTFF